MELRSIGDSFAVEVVGLDITTDDRARHADELRAAIDEHGALVVRDTAQDDAAYIQFAQVFGELQRSTAKLRNPDSGKDDRLVDISNVDDIGEIAAADSIQRTIMLGARLWHTDNSFRNPSTRYTILAARTIATEGGETQFRDMRAAYDALPDDLRTRIDDMRAIHDFEFSRKLSNGPEISPAEGRAHRPFSSRSSALTR
jgi:alpha-ketoglutarate-dependent 2,4-dichlorophenoxyacetate dioxygenase